LTERTPGSQPAPPWSRSPQPRRAACCPAGAAH